MITTDKRILDAFPQWQQQLPLFFRRLWLQAVGCADYMLLVDHEEEVLHAVGLFPFDRKAGLKIGRNPLLTPYSGFYFTDATAPAARAEKVKTYLRVLPALDAFDFLFLPEFSEVSVFRDEKFQTAVYRTFFLDLSAEEAVLFQGLPSRKRSYIRKGEAAFTVKEHALDWEAFMHWHQYPYRKKKVFYPYSIDLLKKVTDTVNRAGNGRFLTAYKSDGTFLAALWVVWDHQKAYNLLSCYNEDCRNSNAIYLLNWKAIIMAKKMGLAFYDFEGSMDPGIAAFFRSFGGTEKKYWRIRKVHSLLWKLKLLLFH